MRKFGRHVRRAVFWSVQHTIPSQVRRAVRRRPPEPQPPAAPPEKAEAPEPPPVVEPSPPVEATRDEDAEAKHRARVQERKALKSQHQLLGPSEFVGEPPQQVDLVVCTCVRNEGDILEPFIDFHLRQGADFVLAVDHDSSDRSAEILESHASRGRLAYATVRSPALRQGDWMTSMARFAAELGARWVINADCDEFWMPRSGSLAELFAALPAETNIVHAFHQDFLPAVGHDGFSAARQVYWDPGLETGFYTRTWEPKVAHRASPSVRIVDGNHDVRKLESPSPLGFLPIDIFHFPIRSYEQLERKVSSHDSGWRHRKKPRHVIDFAELIRNGEFRAFYDRVISEEAIAEGVAEGRLIEDRRLADYVASVDEHGLRQTPGPAVIRELAIGREALALRSGNTTKVLGRSKKDLVGPGGRGGESDKVRRDFRAQVFRRGRFSSDWFTHNIPHWEAVMRSLEDRETRMLEIGSYEGLSACFLLWRLPRARITCVDTFSGSEEHQEGSAQAHPSLGSLESIFDSNIALVDRGRVRKVVGDSRRVLVDLGEASERFDLVYVDGSHMALDVMVDASLSWPLLNPGGVLIFDDYKWDAWKDDPLRTPRPAIDRFLELVEGKYGIEFKGYQVAIRKLG